MAVIVLSLGLLTLRAECSDQRTTFFYEDFADAANWEHYSLFDDVEPTTYTFVREKKRSYLKAESRASSSALLCTKPFDVSEFPRLRWRWKVDTIYKKEDLCIKAGNDAPARVCVLFEYEPANAGFFKRITYSVARKRLGEYPPDSGLCYAWASRTYKENIFKDPKWKIVKTIILESGPANVGTWREATVHIVDDYRKAFRKAPPRRARLVLMNDSNNTGEQAVSYFDVVEVYR